MGSEMSLKRLKARISTMYHRQSTEQPESNKATKELTEIMDDDKIDTASISSDESFYHSNTDASEWPKCSNQSDDSSCSTELDFLGIPPSHTSETSSEREEKEEVEMVVVEDTDTETDTSIILTGAWSPQQMFDEKSENLQDFLGWPSSNQNSDDANVEEEEEEGGDDGEEENESRPAIGEQTSQRRSRKQSNPEKRKDRVTKEIIKYQSTTKLLIPRIPFQRIVREVMQQFKNGSRLQSPALECLRESSEAYLVQLFEDANLASFHQSHVALQVEDMRLVLILRGSSDPGRK